MGGQPTTRPDPSALQLLFEEGTDKTSPHPAHLQHLAIQIQHNLRHQHNWTDLQIHHYSALPPPTTSPDAHSSGNGAKRKRTPLPRPIISGLPPTRLYIHPDEQIALLQAQKAAGNGPGLGQVKPEREWVLPSHLREKWSLRTFGEVFEGVDLVPPSPNSAEDDGEDDSVNGEDEDEAGDGLANGVDALSVEESSGTAAKAKRGKRRRDTEAKEEENPWRKTKRVLLATLDDDSTVVYYIVHNGIVKPRQN